KYDTGGAHMERRSFVKLMGAAGVAAASAPMLAGKAEARSKVTIALVPGLTADGFYVTMHKGAIAASQATGGRLIYQGAAEWNVSAQVPILEAVIAKKTAAVIIAPTDKK